MEAPKGTAEGLEPGGSRADGPSRRTLVGLAWLCAAVTLSLGVAKLFIQRDDLPAHASPGYNTYEGFVSVDQYCLRAEKLAAWMLADELERPAARARALDDLRHGGHPTAVLLPAVIGLAGRATGSLVLAFVLLSSAAFLAQVAVTMRLGERIGRGLGSGALLVGPVAAVLAAAHLNSARNAAQRLLDPFAALWATSMALAALRWQERPSHGSATLLFLAQLTGCFIKLSYFPLLALPALVALAGGGPGRFARTLRAAFWFGALPALPAIAYIAAVPGFGNFGGEMNQAAAASNLVFRELGAFSVEVALVLQAFPLLIVASWSRLTPPGRGVVLGGLALLASLLALRLPDVHRLYLPLVGLFAAGSAPVLVARVERRLLIPLLAAYAAANVAILALMAT